MRVGKLGALNRIPRTYDEAFFQLTITEWTKWGCLILDNNEMHFCEHFLGQDTDLATLPWSEFGWITF